MKLYTNTIIFIGLKLFVYCCRSEAGSIEATRAKGFNQIFHKDGLNIDMLEQAYSEDEIDSRKLQEIDAFAELNLLLSQWKLVLKPLDYFDLPAPLSPTTSLSITNTRCTDIEIGAIRHAIVRDDTEAINTFRLGNLATACEFDWAFKNWLIVLETGSAQLKASGVKIELNIVTKSDDFNTDLPKSTSLQEIDGCVFEMTLDSLELQGFIRAFFANIFDELVRDSIVSAIGPQVCEIFNRKKMPYVERLIQNVTTIATPYIDEITKDDVDALEPQRNLFIPNNARLLNFTSRDPNEFGVTVFESVKNNFNEEYGKYIPDENGNPFLAVNQVVRDFLLDENNILSFPFMDAMIEQNDFSFENCDFNVCIKASLKNVRVRGLDSIEEFDILEPIGRQTATNYMKWSDFGLETVVKIDFMSTDPDLPFELLMELPTSSYDLTAITKFKDLESTLAFLSALDLNILLGIKLRQILNSECALAFLPAMDVSRLDISFDNTEIVQVSNFISSGVETLASSLIEAFFSMFEIGMQKALPNYVGTSFREIIGETLETTLDAYSNQACQPITGNRQEFVNFNDLFYNTTEASSLGVTSDSMPYGDSIAEVKQWFDETMLNPNIRGFPSINELFIKPVTQIFSETIGKLSFDIPALECNGTVTTAFSFEIVDILIESLDSLGYPLKLLEPQENNPYVLKNNINVGAEKPLSLSSNIIFSIGSDGQRNALKLSLNFTNTDIFGDIYAKIREDSFLDFPLRDAFNPFCYLSSIPLPTSILSSTQTISFRNIEIGKGGATLSADCTDCGSAGMTELPKLLSVLKSGIDLVTTRILQTSEEFLNGSDSQGLLNNLLSVAGRACPHHPDYDENFDTKLLISSLVCQGPLLPTLSQNSTELIIISTILMSYMGAIIVPLSLGLDSYPESDPLSAQSVLDTNGLISFEGSLTDTLLSRSLTSMLARIDEIIGDSRIDVATLLSTTANLTNSSEPMDQIQNNLGINSIFGGLDPLQIDVYRSWDIPSPSFSDINDITNITVEVVRIFGLDDFNDIKLFNPLGSQTIQSSFGINNAIIELIGSIHLPSTQPQRIEAKVNITDIQFNSSILLAIDEEIFSNIKVGSLFDTNLSLSCVIPAFRSIDLTQARTSIGTIESISYSGFLSNDTFDILSESTQSFLDEYTPFLTTILPSLADDYIREIVNERIRTLTQNSVLTPLEVTLNCPSYQGSDSFIDFNKMFLQDNSSENQTDSENTTINGYGNIPIIVRNFIDNYFEAPDTRFNFRTQESTPKLNGYLPERIVFQNDPIDFQVDLNQTRNAANDYVNIKISEMVLQNVDSVGYPLEILKPNPNEPYTLENKITVGTQSRPMLAQFIFEGSLTGSSTNITERLNVTLQISEAQLSVSTRSKIDANAFFNLPFLGLFNIDCLLATIPPPSFFGEDLSKTLSVDLDLIYSNLKVSVQCIECSTAQFESLEDRFESPTVENRLNGFGLAFIQYLKGPLKEALQLQIDAALLSAGPQCVGLSPTLPDFAISTQFPTNARRFGIGIILPFSFGVIILILISKYIKSKMKSNHQRWLLSLREDQLLLLYFKQVQAEKREKDDVENASSILFNVKIFTFTRYLVPLLIITSFALFVMGHSNVAAYTNITGDVGGEQVLVFQFFKLKLIDTIVSGWNNGTRVLSIIFVFTSILWPYGKLILTLGTWIIPPSVLSIKKRGEVLNWLDLLTKWSVLSMFVLFLIIPFYNISIVSSEEPLILPEDFYDIKVVLVLVWGFYSFLFGQILSHIISNLCSNAQEQLSNSNRFFSENDHISMVVSEDGIMPMESVDNRLLSSHERSKSSSIGLKENDDFKYSNIDTQGVPPKSFDDSKSLDLKVKKEIGEITVFESFGKTSKEFKEVTEQKDEIKPIDRGAEVNKGQTKSLGESPTGIPTHIEESNLQNKTEKEVANVVNEETSVDHKSAPTLGSQKGSTSVKFERGSEEINSAKSKMTTQQSHSVSADDSENLSLSFSLEERNDYGRKCALCQNSFKKDVFSRDTSMKVTENANTLIRFLCLLTIILLFTGYGTTIFIVKIFGLARYLVASEESSVQYSAFQVVRIFQQTAADFTSSQLSSGLLLLASIFIITTVLVPVLKVIFLGMMWFLPMRMRRRYTLLRVVKFLRSWQYLEVFIISVLLLMWLGEAFVETYLDAYCDGLKTTVFPLAVLSGLLDEEDARCIYITVEPRIGLFLLIIASIILEFVTQFVVKATEHHIEDFNDYLDLLEENQLRDARQGNLLELFENGFEHDTTLDAVSNVSNDPNIELNDNDSEQISVQDVRSDVKNGRSMDIADDDAHDDTQNEVPDVVKDQSIEASDNNLAENKLQDGALRMSKGQPIEVSDDLLAENKLKVDDLKNDESKVDKLENEEANESVNQPPEALIDVKSDQTEGQSPGIPKNDSENDELKDGTPRMSEDSLSDVSHEDSVDIRLQEIASRIQRENPRFTDVFTYFLTPSNKAAYNRSLDDEKSEESSFDSDSYRSDDKSSILNDSIDVEKQMSVHKSISASKSKQSSIVSTSSSHSSYVSSSMKSGQLEDSKKKKQFFFF